MMKLFSAPVRSAAVSLLSMSAWALLCMGRVSAQVQTNQFIPLDQARKQVELSPAPLLYGAYAFVWAAVVVYVFTLWRRLGRVERELRDVTARIAAKQ